MSIVRMFEFDILNCQPGSGFFIDIVVLERKADLPEELIDPKVVPELVQV